MLVSDDEIEVDLRDEDALEAFLGRRRQVEGVGVNGFWMGCKDGRILAILVRGDLACLDYMGCGPKDDFFTSQGDVRSLAKEAFTAFFVGSERTPVPNTKVVSLDDALRATKEFFRGGELPGSIRWLRL